MHPNGNVYVTGSASDNAFKITPAGTITQIIDSSGDGIENPLDAPTGVAVDGSENVYVAAVNSNNVFKITPGGTITQIIDSIGSGGNLEFYGHTFSVAVDPAENVYVTGISASAAFKITPGGVITQIIDSIGDGQGNELYRPADIAVDSSGVVYVASSGDVFQITPGGTITQIIDQRGAGGDRFSPGFGPTSVAIGNDGDVYASGWAYTFTRDSPAPALPSIQIFSGVFKITPELGITEIHDYRVIGPSVSFEESHVAAVDSSDIVYVTLPHAGNALAITPLGDITEIIDATGDGGGNPLLDPLDIATDSSGNVYVVGSTSDNVFRITVGLPACNDGMDNDGDGLTDFPIDPGCQFLASETEVATCDDGIDNDSDSLTDFPADPGCESGHANIENPECNDGLDNDTDGKTDFPSDRKCASASDASEVEFAREWVGTLTTQVGTMPTLGGAGQGVAHFSGGSISAPSKMRLAGGLGFVGTAMTGGFAELVVGVLSTAKLGSGTLVPTSGGTSFATGAIPIRGLQRLCLLSSCSSNAFNQHAMLLTTNSGSNGVGVGGDEIVDIAYYKELGYYAPSHLVYASIQGAPWTLGSATAYDKLPSGPLLTRMAYGFIHSQASSSAFSPSAVVRLVAPSQLTLTDDFETTHQKLAMFSTLTLQFIPEPTAPLILIGGAVLLGVLGRTTRGKTRNGGTRY